MGFLISFSRAGNYHFRDLVGRWHRLYKDTNDFNFVLI